MDKNITILPEQIPVQFPLCTASGCKALTSCLRHLSVEALDENLPSFHCLNPKVVYADKGEACPYFYKAEMTEWVRGFTQIMGQIPSANVLKVRQSFLQYVSQPTYYRLRNGSIPLRGKLKDLAEKILTDNGAQLPLRFDQTAIGPSFPVFWDEKLQLRG